jgi:uncharacterized membrane protein YgaE (UPF0421/DUF939 family)
MSSVRRGSERCRAALLCAGLAALSFALLGWQAWVAMLTPLRVVAGVVTIMLEMTAHTIGEAFAGVALMLRVLGGQILNEPGALGIYIILALGAVLLFRLITSYHRAPRLPD